MEKMIAGIGGIYITGMVCWVVGWGIIYLCTGLKSVFKAEPLRGKFYRFLPILLCLIILGINWWIWREPCSYEKYAQEVKIIEFVERNAGWLILAITVVMIVLQPLIRKKGIQGQVINYQLWALIFAILTLALIWVPSNRPDWLVRLRHIKTIFFSYAISLFIAGIIAFWRKYILSGS
jgi:hypothetical protein